MSDSDSKVGPRLKAERERQGSSLQKAADALRLDSWIVGALEADDFARVGPPVFVKGHLRRYARLLGLPAEDLVAGYDALVQAPQVRAAAPRALQVELPPVARLTWPPVAAFAALVIVGVASLWFKPWRAREIHAPPAPNRIEAASGGALLSSAGAAPSVMDAARAALLPGHVAANPVAPPAADPPQGSGHARLRLSFSADSWVDVHDAAGRRVFAGNGRANSVRTLSGDAPMHVYLRYASGVQLEINNRAVAIGRQFMAGDMARFEAGADGVLRREPPAAAAVPVAQARDPRPTG